MGTELDTKVSYAGIAQACGLKGVVARTQDELTAALNQAIEDQKNGITTLIEALINQELGEPFSPRRNEKTRRSRRNLSRRNEKSGSLIKGRGQSV